MDPRRSVNLPAKIFKIRYLINHGSFRGRACFLSITRLCKLCPNC